MTPRRLGALLVLAVALTAAAGGAHITPPVVLLSDREVLIGLLAGSRRFFVREVEMAAADRQAIRQQWGWTPDEPFYRFYLGRDEGGQLVAAATFVTDFTIHGPVRVAVGLGPDGRVRGAAVTELTEETYTWVKPLLDQDFTRGYIGRDSRGPFGLSERTHERAHHADSMAQFYGQVIASLIQRAAILYEVLLRGAPDARERGRLAPRRGASPPFRNLPPGSRLRRQSPRSNGGHSDTLLVS
jgi:hypothetical protein